MLTPHSTKYTNKFTSPQIKKTPSSKGVVRLIVSTNSRLANIPKTCKQYENSNDGEDSLPEAGAEPAFPSLSKGTLKTTYTITTSITNSDTIHYSMLKDYPDRVKLFNFKNPFKTSNIDPSTEVSDAVNDTDKTRTPEQIMDSESRSIARSKREMADLIEVNDFDKFATLTFDPKRHPKANDYDYAKRIIIRWLGNQQRLYGAFRYVLVSERQKNGNIHFHAVLGGFTGKYHPTNTRGNGKTLRQCYKIASWERNYGFADMEDISNKQAIANYVGKYLTKEFSSSLIQGKGERRYFSSKGLMRPTKTYDVTEIELAATGNFDMNPVDRYENDFVIVKTIKKL